MQIRQKHIFFRRLMAWRCVCMYMLAALVATRRAGRRRVDGGSPALVDSHVSWLCSFPPPRARPTTRPNLYNVRSYRWLRLGLSFVYFYVYRSASARYARPHQSSEASQQQPIQRATTPRVATCPPARYYRALAGCFGWRARQKTAVFQLP